MILIIRQKATRQQIDEMLEELDPLIKLAVDIKHEILAGGGEMHADCEGVLLEDGSSQQDIWGANWIPATKTLPAVGRRSPAQAINKVVLPAPLGPTMATNSPAATVRLMSWSGFTDPFQRLEN